jgi:hypothetical protein
MLEKGGRVVDRVDAALGAQLAGHLEGFVGPQAEVVGHIHEAAQHPARHRVGVVHQPAGGRRGHRAATATAAPDAVAALTPARRLAPEQALDRIGDLLLAVADRHPDDFDAVDDLGHQGRVVVGLGAGGLEGDDDRAPAMLAELIDKLDRADASDGLERRKFARDHQQGARFRHCALPLFATSGRGPGRSGPGLPSCWPGRAQGAGLEPAAHGVVAEHALDRPAISTIRQQAALPSRTASTAPPPAHR